MPVATIFVEDVLPKMVTTTDEDGNFVLTNVPLGRKVLQVSYIGYLPQKTEAIILSSAKSVTVKI